MVAPTIREWTSPEIRRSRRWTFAAALLLAMLDAWLIWHPDPFAGAPALFHLIVVCLFFPGGLLLFQPSSERPPYWLAIGLVVLINGVFWYGVARGFVWFAGKLRGSRKG